MQRVSHIGSTITKYIKQISFAAVIAAFFVTVAGGYAVVTAVAVEAAPAAPANVKAIAGGNNIAVIWDASAGSILNYQVYRNGVLFDTVTPGGVLEDYKYGTRYIDNAVTAGTTYQYQIKAVATDNTVSPLSAITSATRPAVGSTTPQPTITIDTSQATDLASYMTTYIAPELQTWYPKVSDSIAYPNYSPMNAFTISVDPATTTRVPDAAAYAEYQNHIIYVDPISLRSNLDWGGALLTHEATHLIQAYPSDPTGWVIESLAEYTGYHYLTRIYAPVNPLPGDKITDGYAVGAYLLNYMKTNYDATVDKKVNTALHNSTYTSSFFPNDTGKTDTQMWTDMRANRFSAPAPIVGNGTKCVEVLAAVSGSGTKINTCNGSTAQQWGVAFNDVVNHDTTKGFKIVNSSLDPTGNKNICLDVYAAGTADGTQVYQWGCTTEIAEQQWKTGANGSIINPNSGKCLQAAGGSTTDGTGLVISTCNGSAAQNWKMWFTNSGIDQRYASDQAFRTALGVPTVAETTSGIYSYKGYSNGRAYNTTRSGVHEVHGPIWTKYNAAGGHTSYGEPTTDQKPTPDGVGQFNEFYGAGTTGVTSIYWTPSTGAQLIHGTIRDRWGVTGWEAGMHGYPTSSEATTPNGRAQFNNFQNGGIYWSSTTGAQSVWGAIYSRWGALGYENSFLGLPTTSELTTPSGIGRYNVFQNGSIYWSPNSGAWSVGGAIRDRWGQLGWETSYLGYPTSDEFSIAGGRRSNFQNGYITWNSSNGVVSDFHY